MEGDRKKTILEELEERLSSDNLEDFQHYTQNTQKYENMPDNQYSHAWSLINVRQGKPRFFDDLLNPHLFLGSIDDVKSLRFYQNDMFWLTGIFALARHDPAMDYVFEPLWSSFIAEVRFTSSLDGSERIYQAFNVPKSTSRGFRLFRPKKKKKEPMEYIIPNEDEQGMY
jgi:hypothetical protein